MDPQLLSSIKKWINIAIKELGINFIFSKLIALVGFIIWIGFVFYSSTHGLIPLKFINELKKDNLWLYLFLFSLLMIFVVGSALMLPFIVYLSNYSYANKKLSPTYIKPYEVLLATLYLPYGLSFLLASEIFSSNPVRIICAILIFFLITVYCLKKSHKKEREGFLIRIIISNFILFFSIYTYSLLFAHLLSQLPISLQNWIEIQGSMLSLTIMGWISSSPFSNYNINLPLTT